MNPMFDPNKIVNPAPVVEKKPRKKQRPKPKFIDYDKIEREYCAGILTVREIAAKHGITHQMILLKAKKLGWVRNLKDRIDTRTQEILYREMFPETYQKLTERGIIEGVGKFHAEISMCQQARVETSRSIFLTLQHRVQTEAEDPLKQTPHLVDTYKKLIDSQKALVELEIQAYKIKVDEPSSAINVQVEPMHDFLNSIVSTINKNS